MRWRCSPTACATCRRRPPSLKSSELTPDPKFKVFLDIFAHPKTATTPITAAGSANQELFQNYVVKWQAGKVVRPAGRPGRGRQADRRAARPVGGHAGAVAVSATPLAPGGPAPRLQARDRRAARRRAAWRRRRLVLGAHEPVDRRLHGLLRLSAARERVPVVHALRPDLAARAGSARPTTRSCSTTTRRSGTRCKNTLWLMAFAVPLQVIFAFGVAGMLVRAQGRRRLLPHGLLPADARAAGRRDARLHLHPQPGDRAGEHGAELVRDHRAAVVRVARRGRSRRSCCSGSGASATR